MTFENDLESIKTNRHAQDLGQRSFSSNVFCPNTRTNIEHRHTRTDNFTWTTEVIYTLFTAQKMSISLSVSLDVDVYNEILDFGI